MYVVGLTGGIGSGKTLVSDRLWELGATVVDADVVAREVVEPGSSALQQIVEYFGDQVLSAEGTLDRTALRGLIFADEQKRQWLEGLLHPLIGEEMQRQMQASAAPYQIQVAPLLLERGRAPHLQRVLVVDAPGHLQVQRTVERDGGTEAQVREIMKAQLTREQRLALADDVIVNDGDLEQLQVSVDGLHSSYIQLAMGQPV